MEEKILLTLAAVLTAFVALGAICMLSGLYRFWREIFINRRKRCQYKSRDLQNYKTECGNDFFNSDDSQPITDWATYCPYCSGKIKDKS